jgi:translation initiation factor IF-1
MLADTKGKLEAKVNKMCPTNTFAVKRTNKVKAVITNLRASSKAKIILKSGFNPKMARFLYATKSFLNLNV